MIREMIKKLFNDDAGVSPIIATLVLIVVAIAGAAAVGVIMGSFSSNVSDDANTGNTASASSTEIVVAGSTTVQPVSELLAEKYMSTHPGIKISVQGGGSGAGVSSVGMGIVDIGAASRDIKQEEADKYPEIKTYKIGGSAVVFVTDAATADFTATKAELANAFVNNTIGGSLTTAGITKLYQRADESGTEDTVSEYLAGSSGKINSAIEGASGNAGVASKVGSTAHSLGFVDFGFADGSSTLNIVGITDGTHTYSPTAITSSAIKTELQKQDGSGYVTKLSRPLNYMTNGEPTSVQKSFIDFAMTPEAVEYFHDCGYFAITEL
jgi:phosphate transport system substrate-binding protein